MTLETEALVKLAGEITQGKWRAYDNGLSQYFVAAHGADDICELSAVGDEANARAIALVPDLLAEVIALRGQVAKYNAMKGETK